jgi:alpha-glucuronidase
VASAGGIERGGNGSTERLGLEIRVVGRPAPGRRASAKDERARGQRVAPRQVHFSASSVTGNAGHGRCLSISSKEPKVDPVQRVLTFLSMVVAALLSSASAAAEDGHDLWLRYRPILPQQARQYRPHATSIVMRGDSATLRIARDELQRGLGAMLGNRIESGPARDGAILLQTFKVRQPALGSEGYAIRTTLFGGHRLTAISANRDIGVLYGVFAYLRLIQTGKPVTQLAMSDAPRLKLRLLNHWDNPDGTVERGYAGPSLWRWDELPGRTDPRYVDYARANASIGVNGTVLNNVNSKARILTAPYLDKVAALADVFRPYGIRVYLSARFSAPMEIGGLTTADPLDPQVRTWWKGKADEIYRKVPDFGGFLVKANSEGQPGPQDYGRTHADGANMLAAALAPHGGAVFWRAFVYSTSSTVDRAKQAYDEFKPLDGMFARNVILQVKNGPIDFQPREPFSPLFGAIPRTRLAMEVQLTKEYLGHNTHLAYLGTMWAESLESRTHRPRPSSTVADTITAMAGVANIGSSRKWTGSDFDQANWYAFGRLAWNPAMPPSTIAEEWARQNWGNDLRAVQPIAAMMMRSRQAVVDYMTPLGLAHLMGGSHHYGPAPWESNREHPSWSPTYYHRADRNGIGFDRTATGSKAVGQYAPPVARRFASLKTVGDDYLLWFHHVPWSHRVASGRTLWEDLVVRYDRGIQEVVAMNRTWAGLQPLVDADRHRDITRNLRIQLQEARWWRDASIAYFQSVSGLPLPPGHSPPAHDLSWYKAIHFDTVPGFEAPRIAQGRPCVMLKETRHASADPSFYRSRPRRLRPPRNTRKQRHLRPRDRRPHRRSADELHQRIYGTEFASS